MANTFIKGTHHIAIRPKGSEAFQKTMMFYTEVLGLPIVRTWGEGENLGAMVSTGDSMMEITSNGRDVPTTGAVYHFALATDDVDAVVEKVREAGYEITQEPRDAVIESDPAYPIRIAFCAGPTGESIEFFEER